MFPFSGFPLPPGMNSFFHNTYVFFCLFEILPPPVLSDKTCWSSPFPPRFSFPNSHFGMPLLFETEPSFTVASPLADFWNLSPPFLPTIHAFWSLFPPSPLGVFASPHCKGPSIGKSSSAGFGNFTTFVVPPLSPPNALLYFPCPFPLPCPHPGFSSPLFPNTFFASTRGLLLPPSKDDIFVYPVSIGLPLYFPPPESLVSFIYCCTLFSFGRHPSLSFSRCDQEPRFS